MLRLPLLLLLLPTLFQLYVGTKAVRKTISFSLDKVCLLSFTFQVIITYIAIEIAAASYLNDAGLICGMPLFVLFVFSIIITFVMIIIMLVQIYLKRKN